MTVRERVLANRLIQKIDDNERYAKQIGLSYVVVAVGDYKSNSMTIRKKERKY